jgi:putative flippase GtrA
VYEAVRFGVVGGMATLVHLAVAWGLLAVWPELNLLAVNLLSFAVAVFVSYFGHMHFTFARRGRAHRFLLTALVGLLVNNGLLLLIANMTEWRYLAVVVATLAAPVVVFLMSKFWVFRQEERSPT